MSTIYQYLRNRTFPPSSALDSATPLPFPSVQEEIRILTPSLQIFAVERRCAGGRWRSPRIRSLPFWTTACTTPLKCWDAFLFPQLLQMLKAVHGLRLKLWLETDGLAWDSG
uniref:DNA-directed RNA polymerase subunit beta n=1 Tax=Anthurium amnicola TaxID=1678845 RepID=A0A1D1YRQ0_9ARAE